MDAGLEGVLFQAHLPEELAHGGRIERGLVAEEVVVPLPELLLLARAAGEAGLEGRAWMLGTGQVPEEILHLARLDVGVIEEGVDGGGVLGAVGAVEVRVFQDRHPGQGAATEGLAMHVDAENLGPLRCDGGLHPVSAFLKQSLDLAQLSPQFVDLLLQRECRGR